MKMLKKPARIIMIYLLFSAITVIASYYFLSKIFQEDSIFTFNEARLLVNGVIHEIENNYNRISDSDTFSSVIKPFLDDWNGKLEIIDTSGRLIYSTEDDRVYERGHFVDIKSQLHYDASLIAECEGMAKFAFPIVVDGQQMANGIFTLPQHLVVKRSTLEKTLRSLCPVFAILILFSILFIMSYRYLHIYYLYPLQQLNNGIRDMARGNLEEPIFYINDGEFGKLCGVFDLMRKELKESMERQVMEEKARKELITNISHDLKTPIASIKAYVEGLLDGVAQNPVMVEKYLSVIHRKTDSLSNLIDDLLQHSLKELGQLEINLQEEYSRELLQRILEPIIVQFEKHSVSFFVDGELPDVLIQVDSVRLEQIITNLVQNAKKYTAEGGRITFTAENLENHLKISIKDTGYGVAPEELPYIFETYYRGQRFRNMDFEGAGLGLSICKYIVEKHGGEIQVTSKLNEGSTFSFTILKV